MTATTDRCPACLGMGTVCECHPGRPWGGLCCAGPEVPRGTACAEFLCQHGACHCGGAGQPCYCQPPASDEETVASYRGVIVIEWPAASRPGPYGAMLGRMTSVSDAVTGKQITTCSRVVVRAEMNDLVAADLTLFADEDGEPVLDGDAVIRDGEALTGVFPFLVGEMKVRP